MPKAYNIKEVNKDKNGVIQGYITEGGMIKTKPQVINDINKGYNINVKDNHGHQTKVINIQNEYVRTVPTKRDCDNLSNL